MATLDLASMMSAFIGGAAALGGVLLTQTGQRRSARDTRLSLRREDLYLRLLHGNNDIRLTARKIESLAALGPEGTDWEGHMRAIVEARGSLSSSRAALHASGQEIDLFASSGVLRVINKTLQQLDELITYLGFHTDGHRRWRDDQTESYRAVQHFQLNKTYNFERSARTLGRTSREFIATVRREIHRS